MKVTQREELYFVCVSPKMLNPKKNKDIVNLGNFTQPELFILAFLYLFYSLSLSLLCDKIYFNVYFVYLKTLLSRVAVSVKLKMNVKKLPRIIVILFYE